MSDYNNKPATSSNVTRVPTSLRTEPVKVTKKFLALDLDETLIHCEREYFSGVSAVTRARICGQEVDLYVSKRPGLEEFMDTMAKHYNLILYTAGQKEYAYAVLKLMRLDRYFQIVLHRSYCQKNSDKKFEKDLAIVGIHPRDIILVDDSFVHVRNQPNNILLIEPFTGEASDRELSRISDYLVSIANKVDVRPVMGNFTSYERQRAAERILSAKTGVTNKNSKDSCSDDFESEFNAEDVCESFKGALLSTKVPAITTQKTLLALKVKFNSGIRLEERDDDEESTDDSFEELAVNQGEFDVCGFPAIRIPLTKLGTEECLDTERLAESLPTMTPKSQLTQLKTKFRSL
mmetsp:Transcript_17854/g.20375  ORF Transcript_17854/g.20375 Transcript_17854/m.20375 type:complete len:348 (-) Transcript_17854:303-1346(-)